MSYRYKYLFNIYVLVYFIKYSKYLFMNKHSKQVVILYAQTFTYYMYIYILL